jgi:hypothetical protein
MSKSLKEQLLALGLAPAKKQAPRKPLRHTKIKRDQAVSADISLDQAYRIRKKEERHQKEQDAASKREQQRQRRWVNQKIAALVKKHAIRDESAETKRNFLFKGRIRTVLVTADQNDQINRGRLAVMYLSGNYHLLPSAGVEEVRTFAADHVPDLGGAEPEGEEENPVPDDLMW